MGRRRKVKRPKKTYQQRFIDMVAKILSIVDIEFKFSRDFKSACAKADQFINARIHSHPEEKELVLSAAKHVKQKLDDAFGEVRRERAANQGSHSGSSGEGQGERVEGARVP